MSESREDIIEIKDCGDSEIFQRILFYWELLNRFFKNRIFEIFVHKRSKIE